MATKLPYTTSADALMRPARNTVFFQGWDRDIDSQDHNLLCAEMSRLAYAEPADVTQSLAGIGFAAAGFIELHGTQGFVANNAALRLSVLAFRGTEPDGFEDLMSDLDTLQTNSHDGSRVHSGFLKAYDAVVQERVDTLLQQREDTLLVTGHSLGAALASLAALHTQPAVLITFGSPRVGDARFGQLFDGLAVRRFVNCCDVVARIPPECFDHEHLLQLLTELGNFKQLKFLGLPLDAAAEIAADGAARILASAFQGAAAANTFKHIAPPSYIRADGTIAQQSTNEQILADQQAGRDAYAEKTKTGLAQLPQLIASLRTPRSLLGSLFGLVRGDPVPLRDLADHAPLNYVSAFTGRG